MFENERVVLRKTRQLTTFQRSAEVVEGLSAIARRTGPLVCSESADASWSVGFMSHGGPRRHTAVRAVFGEIPGLRLRVNGGWRTSASSAGSSCGGVHLLLGMDVDHSSIRGHGRHGVGLVVKWLGGRCGEVLDGSRHGDLKTRGEL